MNQPNLSKFQTLIRHSVRMLYTDPIIHLLIDFIIDNNYAEPHTFAHRIKIKYVKQVQSAF